MSSFVIAGICLGGLLLIVIALIFTIRSSNAKRFDKKFKKQFSKVEEDVADLSFEEPLPKIKNENVTEATVEEYNPQEEENNFKNQILSDQFSKTSSEAHFEKAIKHFEEISKRNKERLSSRQKMNEKDDFEEFMNNHSYGRMLTNKRLVART